MKKKKVSEIWCSHFQNILEIYKEIYIKKGCNNVYNTVALKCKLFLQGLVNVFFCYTVTARESRKAAVNVFMLPI